MFFFIIKLSFLELNGHIQARLGGFEYEGSLNDIHPISAPTKMNPMVDKSTKDPQLLFKRLDIAYFVWLVLLQSCRILSTI